MGGDGSESLSFSPVDLGSPPRGRGRRRGDRRLRREPGLTPAWAGTAGCGLGPPAEVWAHPRVGGDGSRWRSRSRSSAGSPPRGRGRRVPDAERGQRDGLTPAWAGTARSKWAWGPLGWAHPRVGGDGQARSRSLRLIRGSPPRGRGRRSEPPPAGGDRGLTPAWAGTAASRSSTPAVSRAHPRVGGDGTVRSCSASGAGGSPPRGRGRPAAVHDHSATVGLTPAWAGTAENCLIRRPRRRAHPRVGGDGDDVASDTGAAAGSPPRGRGRLVGLPAHIGGDGLTPAWAGTATRSGPTATARWAHPRVGGDGVDAEMSVLYGAGSPPRGRGRPERLRNEAREAGLTPAWAGTAIGTAAVRWPEWAHPRVGGDGGVMDTGAALTRGSPPRGRGRPLCKSSEYGSAGLTPAWAGTARTAPGGSHR